MRGHGEKTQLAKIWCIRNMKQPVSEIFFRFHWLTPIFSVPMNKRNSGVLSEESLLEFEDSFGNMGTVPSFDISRCGVRFANT